MSLTEREKRTRRLHAIWREAAQSVDGRFGTPMGSSLPRIQLDGPTGRITVEALRYDSGSMTRVRSMFHAPQAISLSVSDEGLLTGFLKKLGFVQDVEIGRNDFDDRFVAKGFPSSRVKSLLTPVADLLLAQPFVDLRVVRTSNYMPLPPGVAEVRLRRSTIVKDVEHLVGMIEVVRQLLPLLDPVGDRRHNELAQLLARLGRSGGDITDPWGRAVLWDGDPPRREAARLLGDSGEAEAVPPLLDATHDDDDALVAESIDALARLGDPRSVPGLIRLLSHRGRVVDGTSLAERAAEALTSLGEGELVAGLDKALAGDTAGLREAVGHRRTDVVDMLMAVVDSFDLDARVHAATALGALGAREALGLLRDKTKAMGLRTRLTEAARAAITEIEAQANLPRPAEGPPRGVDTLPRPAKPTG